MATPQGQKQFEQGRMPINACVYIRANERMASWQ